MVRVAFVIMDNFVAEAKRLVGLGAEVIIPMGISQCPVPFAPNGYRTNAL